MPGPVCGRPRGFTGCGLERDGLRPRGGRSPRTPEAHAASPERLRLRHQQRPPVRLVGAEHPAFRTAQCAARQMPARPARRQRPEIAQADDAQQPHHRPRHPAAPGLPIGDRPHGHPEELRRGPPTQQAGPAQFPESLRADVPQTPDRARRTGLPGSVPTGFDSRICILCQIDEGIRRYEHRSPSLPLARTEIERWRRECVCRRDEWAIHAETMRHSRAQL